MLAINFIVLSCSDIEQSKLFYEKLGLNFSKEQHENGPIHYAGNLGHVILELYPSSKRFPVEKSVRLGINIENVDLLREQPNIKLKQINMTLFSVEDPDGRIIFITQTTS